MSNLVLTEIWRYPVKSLRGGRHTTLPVGSRGLAFDRHWMLVDPEGRFVTQRQVSRMALIRARLDATHLRLNAPDMPELALPADEVAGESLRVEVWADRCRAVAGSPVADLWLSEFLGRSVRLVYLPTAETRQVDLQYARPGDRTAFSDGFPLLLIAQASLDELNARLTEPVPMERFRPNLVVSGCAAHAEDDWRRIRIGRLEFRVVKPCSRCVIPSIDLETGEKHPEAQPIRTLLGYRKRGDKVYFGQNLIQDGEGRIDEGMAVEILDGC